MSDPPEGAAPGGEPGADFASQAPRGTAGTLTTDVSQLVDRVDICQRFGISRARFYQWARLEGFPTPVHTFGNGTRVWLLNDVETWKSARAER